ncbi:MAG: hypothetical protein AAFX99_01210 [Myxococcota bacterium]
MSRLDPSDVIFHVNVSVLHCDSLATLEETLKHLSHLPLHIVRLGATSIGFPASEFHTVKQALHEQGRFPRTLGKPERQAMPHEDDR